MQALTIVPHSNIVKEIALHFESIGDFLNAARYYVHAANYARALKLVLERNFVNSDSIDFAIEIIGEANDDNLTRKLIEFLMGEHDGVPKDAKYIFKLYMSMKQYKEAARTSILIAREEQAQGNYRGAHDLLLDNYKYLKKSNVPIPAELDQMLMLLHSYTLVKTLIKVDDHEKSARMLIRVASNISKFPAHTVPILTSTVIECHRAGLKKEAFDFAAILMRPEYRGAVDPKFKRKIEQIVRRPDGDNPLEAESACPYCNSSVRDTLLNCEACKKHLPYCIATVT
jgi:WD repeat-containing protein 19